MTTAHSISQMTLGVFIKALESLDPSAICQFDSGSFVGKADSYRGYYSDLALSPCSTPSTVGSVLAEANAAMGNSFMGYKGGSYLMHPDTRIWHGSYGTTSEGRLIVGFRVFGNMVTILTMDEGK